jgi:hypothetical protein
MSDTEISIIEYAEDVSKAEAPLPLPVRQYPATIEKAEVKTSTNTGNQYVAVSFRVSADDFPADFDASGYDDGIVLTYNRIPVEDSPRARYRMRQFCEAIGAKASKKIDLGEWLGLSATLDVEHNTYEGETRAQIKKVLPA